MRPRNFLRLVLKLAIASIWCCSGQLSAELRTFTDTAGRNLKGELTAINGDTVTIKRDNGQSFTLKASNFCPADITYFEAHGLKLAPTSPKNTPLTPPSKATGAVSKLQPKDFRVLPFCRELSEKLFKPHTTELPDELQVVTTDRIRITGKKRTNTSKVAGRTAGHVGKIVLLPLADHSGKITVKVASSDDATYYYTAFQVTGDSASDVLVTKIVKLTPSITYTWAIKTENEQVNFKILNSATEVIVFSQPANKVNAFGFASTVRGAGNESDILITFD